jgi:hypothetical protein
MPGDQSVSLRRPAARGARRTGHRAVRSVVERGDLAPRGMLCVGRVAGLDEIVGCQRIRNLGRELAAAHATDDARVEHGRGHPGIRRIQLDVARHVRRISFAPSRAIDRAGVRRVDPAAIDEHRHIATDDAYGREQVDAGRALMRAAGEHELVCVVEGARNDRGPIMCRRRIGWKRRERHWRIVLRRDDRGVSRLPLGKAAQLPEPEAHEDCRRDNRERAEQDGARAHSRNVASRQNSDICSPRWSGSTGAWWSSRWSSRALCGEWPAKWLLMYP